MSKSTTSENSQARMRHEPDEILQIFARPDASAVSVSPLLIFELVTRLDDVGKLLVGERDFVGGTR